MHKDLYRPMNGRSLSDTDSSYYASAACREDKKSKFLYLQYLYCIIFIYATKTYYLQYGLKSRLVYRYLCISNKYITALSTNCVRLDALAIS